MQNAQRRRAFTCICFGSGHPIKENILNDSYGYAEVGVVQITNFDEFVLGTHKLLHVIESMLTEPTRVFLPAHAC